MVDVCWLLDPAKCRSHGPGRTCTDALPCWYKTEEAKTLLKRLHKDAKEAKT